MIQINTAATTKQPVYPQPRQPNYLRPFSELLASSSLLNSPGSVLFFLYLCAGSRLKVSLLFSMSLSMSSMSCALMSEMQQSADACVSGKQEEYYIRMSQRILNIISGNRKKEWVHPCNVNLDRKLIFTNNLPPRHFKLRILSHSRLG